MNADETAPSPTPGGIRLLRRVGVIGDVHEQDKILEAVLAFLRSVAGLDALLCTGDVVDGEGDANQCCTLLQEAGALTVRGNHDRWFFENESLRRELAGIGAVTVDLEPAARAFLASLPPTRTFTTPRGLLLLCHGLGDDDMKGVYPIDEGYALEANDRLQALISDGTHRFVVNGHTHRRMVRTLGPLTVINAGTLQWGYEPCFLTADFEAGTVRYYDVSADDLTITEADTFSLPARG